MAQFEKQTLIQGKKLYEAGKVVQVTLMNNQFKARVLDDKDYVVTFTISKNQKISKKTCSCHQDCCVHQAAAAYAFNDSRKAMPEEKQTPKPVKKAKVVEEIPKNLSLDEYLLEIKKTAKRERDIHQSFMKELDQRLIDAMTYPDACQRVLDLIDEFSKITIYPKNYRNKVINRFRQSFDLLLDIHHNYQEVFTWLLNNRVRMRNREFDDGFQMCIERVDKDYVYQQVLFILVNNDLTYNPYFQDLLEIYFQCVETLNIDLSDALVNIVKYRDQVIYKYYEMKNLIGQNKIEEANLIYHRIKQKIIHG